MVTLYDFIRRFKQSTGIQKLGPIFQRCEMKLRTSVLMVTLDSHAQKLEPHCTASSFAFLSHFGFHRQALKLEALKRLIVLCKG